MSKMNILVLCTGNSCRSQMAEGFFREYGKEDVVVKSAGLDPSQVNPTAIKVMQEIGIDISGHKSTSLSEYLNDSFDYIITVCDNAAEKCPVFPGGGNRLHWPFEDPHYAEGTEEEKLDFFRKVRDQIGEKIKKWLGEKFE
ncbi:MAG: arsenate reductase ArsC [bacterium]